ncbi:alkaline ceramidase-like isoform X2 [Paramacrobiotus metropolitanus]|nr:alkaline ceramidase-like isoform X2 [Paramacrobiotus metropolitanus]XP_055339587.1 alkaline ceramidase-like isoform X2 [Paramacrobiotus metropolitanus]
MKLGAWVNSGGRAAEHEIHLDSWDNMASQNRRFREPWEVLRHLHRGSSEVDWCESNYVVSPTIAEFVNTVSNILFIVIPPLLIVLFQQYANSVKNKDIYLIWTLLIGVGLASAYFHATLSFAGQMLDELAILWLICAGFGIWMPRRYLPSYLQSNRHLFKWTMFGLTVFGSVLACVKPVINAFALMAFGLPITVLLVIEMRRCRNARIHQLASRTMALFAAAVICWINDRLFCDVWTRLHFPYLHGFWHILVFLASYACCVLFAYFDAKEVAPQLAPRLRYWPVDTFEFGIPYVTLDETSEDQSLAKLHHF